MPLPRFAPTPDGAPTAAMRVAYDRDGFLLIDGVVHATEAGVGEDDDAEREAEAEDAHLAAVAGGDI